MRPEPGLRLSGKYLLVHQLARGGMSEVWMARHAELDISVAVKFIDAELADQAEALSRFKREARAAARLQSAHVTRIYDYGVEQGTPYIAMELLEGETLGQRITRKGRLGLGNVAGIVRQLAKGLGEAHAAGIVHRDLKPSNVFLARVAGEEVAKILDFGIAKDTGSHAIVDRAATKSGTLVGSPSYMSPEQARGAALDHRSDLWSLAVTVFESLTGRPLFESEHYGDLIAAITGDRLPVASSVCPELPPAVDAFFERAFARNPKSRFQSVHDLAASLAEIAGLPEPSATPAPDLPPSPRLPLSSMKETTPDLPGRSEPTLDAAGWPESSSGVTREDESPTIPRLVDAPIDTGVASTIRRTRMAPRAAWLAAGVAVVVALGLVTAYWSSEPSSTVASDPGVATATGSESRTPDGQLAVSAEPPAALEQSSQRPAGDLPGSRGAPAPGPSMSDSVAPPKSSTRPPIPASGPRPAASRHRDPMFGVEVSKKP